MPISLEHVAGNHLALYLAVMTLGRLIFALLLACLALPATAAMPCHDDAAMPAMTMEHHTPTNGDHRDPAVAAHVCIGCVPPSSWRRVVHAPRLPATPLIAEWTPTPLALHNASRPATPPPRAA
jgi:hypothetical protein